MSATYVLAEWPKYCTPAKNLRTAEAAADELLHLSGEALQKQKDRVRELLAIANQQNAEINKGNPGAGAFKAFIRLGA
jgi:hypothetical protein